MSLRDRALAAARALMGASVYTPTSAPAGVNDLESDLVERVRKALGGQLEPLPRTPLRWYLADLDAASQTADSGDMSRISQLARAMRRDGMLSGLLKTRTSGLVALPKRWRGRADIVEALTADNGTRSLCDEMFPPAELALLAADGLQVGVGCAELVPVVGRDFPVMIRHDPEYLRFRANEGRWYFGSVVGPIPIDPGDGRWILHTPGGRLNPWQFGLWPALGRAYIDKNHALLHRGNFSGKLANPARVAVAPNGATEDQRVGFLARLIAWGINSVFEMPPGWDVKILEVSNGKGVDVFKAQIDTSDLEIMIALAGQVVTVTGGTGFANADIHKTIRADLIKETADGLAYTINTQGIPPWVIQRFGIDALSETARIEWDTAPSQDRKTEADAMTSVGVALTSLQAALAPHGLGVDANELAVKFGIPVLEVPKVEIDAEPPPAADPT